MNSRSIPSQRIRNFRGDTFSGRSPVGHSALPSRRNATGAKVLTGGDVAKNSWFIDLKKELSFKAIDLYKERLDPEKKGG